MVKSVYPNLSAEMARHEISVDMLAKNIGMTRQAISAKLAGKTKISVSEAKKIRDYVAKEELLDYLFKEKE